MNRGAGWISRGASRFKMYVPVGCVLLDHTGLACAPGGATNTLSHALYTVSHIATSELMGQ